MSNGEQIGKGVPVPATMTETFRSTNKAHELMVS